MNCLKSNKGLSVTSSAGFSLVEVMVVIVIISLLATLAGNRLLIAIARARQAEAKTNLSQIYQLQLNYQMHADNYAKWAPKSANVIGHIGAGTKQCSIGAVGAAAGVGRDGTADGAAELGWRPDGCQEMRYGYSVLVGTDTNGVERFLAIAHATSDSSERVFPTCDGRSGGRTTGAGASVSATDAEVDHESLTSLIFKPAGTPTGAIGTAKHGDTIAVSDSKTWQHSDIIEACD